ncbi:hypothetical protein V491_01607, partial [Pseudogymnoascus sp. VKM F-3775]
MASNNNTTWDDIKSDAFRFYMDEGKDLKTTMAAIREIHGFKASERTWKLKFDEWCYKKNMSKEDMQWIVAKRAKRTAEGKDTAFDYYGTQVTTKRIENFKRRKTEEGPVSMSTPPNIVYSTPAGPESLSASFESPSAASESLPPDLESLSAGFESLPTGLESLPVGIESLSARPEGLPTSLGSLFAGFKSLPAGLDSEQRSITEIFEELSEYNAPLSQMPNVSVTYPSWVGPLSSKIEHPPPTVSNLEKLPFTSAIKRYLLDEEPPWSIFSGLYRNSNSKAKLPERAMQVLGLSDFPKEQNVSLHIRGIGEQFSQNLYSDMCREQEDEPSRAFALDKSCGLAITLAEYQDKLKCSALEIASSAKYMHQVLLEHPTNVNFAHFGSKEEIGHWSYGPFLENEDDGETELRRVLRRTSHIDQLLLACESALKSETHDSQLIAPLPCDFINPLGVEPDENEESSLNLDKLPRFGRLLRENDPDAEEGIQMLTFDMLQNHPRSSGAWSPERQCRVREYLLANHRSSNTSSESGPHLAQPGLFSGTRNPSEGDKDSSSTGSLIESTSDKYGLTYSTQVTLNRHESNSSSLNPPAEAPTLGTLSFTSPSSPTLTTFFGAAGKSSNFRSAAASSTEDERPSVLSAAPGGGMV